MNGSRGLCAWGAGVKLIVPHQSLSPAGPASQKMHYYRYSNAEVSCWYKYLLFSYNIVFWVSPGAPPWSLGRNLHHRVLILPVLLMTRLQGGLGKMWAGSMVPVLLEPARSNVMGAPRRLKVRLRAPITTTTTTHPHPTPCPGSGGFRKPLDTVLE